MGMQTQAVIVLVLCGVFLLLIALYSWYRRRKLAKEAVDVDLSRIQETVVNGQRTFRIATVSRQDGQLALDIYEIRLPRPNDPAAGASIRLLPSTTSPITHSHPQPPPPPFSTAINMPTPEEGSSVAPPPTYEEVIIPNSSTSGEKLPDEGEQNVNRNLSTTPAQLSS